MGLNTNINNLLIIIGCLPSRWHSCYIVQKTSVPCRNCFWKQIYGAYDLTALWDLLVDLLKRKVKSFALKKQFLLLEMERKRGFNVSDCMGNPNYGKEGHFRHFLPSRLNDSVEESYVLDSCLQFLSYFIPSAGLTERDLSLLPWEPGGICLTDY